MKKDKTKNIFKILFLIATFISLFFVPWILVRVWITPLPNTIQEQVNKAKNYGIDGIIVYVDKKGDSPAFYTSGYKNRENKIPADSQSLFKIASVSKLYTAVAVTKLVTEERLSLDN